MRIQLCHAVTKQALTVKVLKAVEGEAKVQGKCRIKVKAEWAARRPQGRAAVVSVRAAASQFRIRPANRAIKRNVQNVDSK